MSNEPHVQRLIFGVDRDPEVVRGQTNGNPCVVAFGPGPEGRTCGDCSHLYLQGGTAGRYYKCELRGNTRGPGTDHRVRWPACARFDFLPKSAR